MSNPNKEMRGRVCNGKDRPARTGSAGNTSGKTLREFVLDKIDPSARVYTDDALL